MGAPKKEEGGQLSLVDFGAGSEDSVEQARDEEDGVVGEAPKKRKKVAAASADNTNSDDWPTWEEGDEPASDCRPCTEEVSLHPENEPASPALRELSSDPRRARLVGAVLGAAIGDAVGNPTEFIGSFEAIREKYPPDGVSGFVLYRDGPDGRFAPFTDDTQMAEVVLRSLLWSRDNGQDLDATMKHLAQGFIEWAENPKGGHRAPGNACLDGCRNLARGAHWFEAGGAHAGGCGSAMRAYPFGLVFARDIERAERWSVAHSKLTHGDPIALAASAAMAVGMARICRGESTRRVLSEMVAAACRYSARTAAMMAQAIEEAWTGVGPEVTLNRLRGWAAHEAIAATVYLFARHPDDPRAAILEGANTPGDSDSLATLVGALTGCRCGIGALPEQWVLEVERSSEFIELGCRI